MSCNMNPILSFVVYTRNDNYQGKSNLRFQTSINYSALVLEKINRLNDVEFVIVDWGSKVPLHTVLRLNKQAKKITRFILVPSSIAGGTSNETDFPTSIVANVGIRRSRGKFITLSAIDILLPEQFLKYLFDVVEGKIKINKPIERTLFVFRRKHVSSEIINYSLFSNKTCPVDLEAQQVESLMFFLFGRGGVFTMHRDMWFECRGFDEKLIFWGWNDIDLVLRMRLKYHCIDVGEKYYVYHIEHAFQDAEYITERKISPTVFNPFLVNDKTWGLADNQFDEFPQRESLEVQNSPLNLTKSFKNDNNYRIKHFQNLFIYLLQNMSLQNLKHTYNYSRAMLLQYPEDHIIKRVYFYLGKLIKK